ncbi:MAG: hypothetical protein E2O75_02535 [Chloroflexi bacterium]|nr:MAG: hypothetical protein E2O75_02535 [Chloroflexota bacterium]
MVDCVGLIGFTELQLRQHLGPAVSRREIGGDTWLVFRTSDVMLRIRCRDAGDGSRCASWTASFGEGFDTLAEAASAVGLWPAAKPDEIAGEVTTPLIRRPLPCLEQSLVCSLTATVRDGRFTKIAVFDEAPDWL